MSNGYYSIPRSLDENEVWESLPLSYQHVFIKIVQLACYKPKKFDDFGTILDLKPGQLCISERELLRRCNKDISKENIHRILKKLIKCGFLVAECVAVRQVITITHKDTYDLIVRGSVAASVANVSQVCSTNKESKEHKESLHPYPSSSQTLKTRTEDLSSKKKIKTPKIEVVPGVFLTQSELDDCIAIKGSLQNVQDAIGYILRKPTRKKKIVDWPNALATWEIKTNIVPVLRENEQMAKRFSTLYENFGETGWRCELDHNRSKDQKGLSFVCNNAHVEPIFIPFIDREFKDKASKVLRDKRMQRGLCQTPKI